jgi:Asp-tRNA(Asn)/Glu-tRNA(Gln) amidotransferase C subunit
MSELTSLEILTGIMDAAPSESVRQLFGIVHAAVPEQNEIAFNELNSDNTVTTNALREDVVIESSETERQIIIDNFPFSKNNYLIVSKVIEE